MKQKEAVVRVGIMAQPEIGIFFNGRFVCAQTGEKVTGLLRFSAASMDGELMFSPYDPSTDTFSPGDVRIGIGFHWEQNMAQVFKGGVLLRRESDLVRVINVIGVEDYLESVVSSEMNADAPLEFLKAHAVISRSWVMRRMSVDSGCGTPVGDGAINVGDGTIKEREPGVVEYVRWYDDSQHDGFDVCADDHCQRYQGVGMLTNARAVEAVRSTAGLVLKYGAQIADTRFSKCCGGAFETFDTCWGDEFHPYLAPGRDFIGEELPDLTSEEVAAKWIMDSPDAFCNTEDSHLLRRVLNNYDRPTRDFYRWEVRYGNGELSRIVNERSGMDIGLIREIKVLGRGVSGRVSRLMLKGTHRTLIVGKELEIRKILSRSHLYSSAFTVETEYDETGPKAFIFHGAGWGHGVGLCQIGAAVMATRGHTFESILLHYYPGTTLAPL